MRRFRPSIFKGINLFAVAMSVGTLTLFCGSAAVAQTNGSLSYQAKCAVCHGLTGLGDTSPGKQFNMKPFTDPSVLAMTDLNLQDIIVNGSGKMPAYKGKLPDAEVTNLIQYIHKLQNSQ